MTVSVEHLLVSKIIEDQSLKEVIDAGVRAIHFTSKWEPVYQWIIDFNAQHGAVPSERAFSAQYGDIDIEDSSQETYSNLIEDLFEGYRNRTVVNSVSEAMGKLDVGDTKNAMSILKRGLEDATAETSKLKDFNIIEGWEKRLAEYEDLRANPDKLRGIATGFTGLDRLTHGFRPQQWIVMVGEQKRGKSLFQLIMARACHISSYTPMCVSYEMSVQEQLSRLDSLNANVPYDRILSGHLSDQEMDRLYATMMRNKNMHPFIMSEDASGATTISALDAKIREHRPHAVYVDGLYLMDDEHGEPKGSPQALTNISRGMKRLAQHHNIPIIGTTQVLSWKLNNKRTRAITADAIGYTSAFAQDADLVLGVERNPDIDDQAIIRIVEARTAPRAEIHVQWDFTTMQFEEVDEVEEDE